MHLKKKEVSSFSSLVLLNLPTLLISKLFLYPSFKSHNSDVYGSSSHRYLVKLPRSRWSWKGCMKAAKCRHTCHYSRAHIYLPLKTNLKIYISIEDSDWSISRYQVTHPWHFLNKRKAQIRRQSKFGHLNGWKELKLNIDHMSNIFVYLLTIDLDGARQLVVFCRTKWGCARGLSVYDRFLSAADGLQKHVWIEASPRVSLNACSRPDFLWTLNGCIGATAVRPPAAGLQHTSEYRTSCPTPASGICDFEAGRGFDAGTTLENVLCSRFFELSKIISTCSKWNLDTVTLKISTVVAERGVFDSGRLRR